MPNRFRCLTPLATHSLVIGLLIGPAAVVPVASGQPAPSPRPKQITAGERARAIDIALSRLAEADQSDTSTASLLGLMPVLMRSLMTSDSTLTDFLRLVVEDQGDRLRPRSKADLAERPRSVVVLESVLVAEGPLPTLAMLDQVGSELGRMARPGVPPYLMGALFAHLMNDIVNYFFVRAADPETAADRLRFENALLVRYLITRCGGEADRCLGDYYPLARSNKGLLGAVLGAVLPAESGLWLESLPSRSMVGAGPTASLAIPDPSRNLLAVDEAFVDVFQYAESDPTSGGRYGAFVSTRELPARFVDLGPRGRIDTAIEAWWRRATLDGAEWQASTASLRSMVWQPIVTILPPQATKVLLAPDGALWRVAWSLLADSGSGGPRQLSVVASWREFAYLRRTPPPEGPRVAALVQDLDFGAGALRPVAARPDLERIFAAAGWRSVRITGRRATHETLARAVGQANVLSVLTHGEALGEGGQRSIAELLRGSTLALSLANVDSTSRLSAADVIRSDWSHLRLVVFAACNTGGGAPFEGQGMAGFQLALAGSGVRTAILSLWPAPDGRSTEIFLEDLYRALFVDQQQPAAALRRAQARLRGIPEFAHPVYWAGWTSAGEAWE